MFDAIFTAPGSLGDVNPVLAMARYFKRSGRSVLFAAAERYGKLVTNAGLEFDSLVPEEELEALVTNPDLWHPRRGLKMVLENCVGEYLEPNYQRFVKHADPEKTIIVAHFLDFSARIFQDRFPKTKLATVILAPSILRSSRQPPKLTAYAMEKYIPRWLYGTFYRQADRILDGMITPQLNAFRAKHQLPPISKVMSQWGFSPDAVVGLFPKWFSPAHLDQELPLKLFGFPLSDSEDLVEQASVVQALQAIDRLPSPPVVFAPGSAHHSPRRFFEIAAAVVRQLNLTAVFLSVDSSQIPSSLPSSIVAAGYLPFSRLLPKASLIVHHGGIGTTSQSFAAGKPQLVMPMAFDQFDNAQRVFDAGCGLVLPMAAMSVTRMSTRIKQLRAQSTIAEKAAQTAPGVAKTRGADLAAQWILDGMKFTSMNE